MRVWAESIPLILSSRMKWWRKPRWVSTWMNNPAGVSETSLQLAVMWPSPVPKDRQCGSDSGPEVEFEDITIDLPEARFWIASGWPSTRELSANDTQQVFSSPSSGDIETAIDSEHLCRDPR